MQIVNFEKVRKYSKKDFLKTFSDYKRFLKFLNSPHKNYKTIIITGSTGKGTTACLLTKILTGHGYRTGCFTSPHLRNVRERITVNDKMISRNEFIKYETLVLKRIKEFNHEANKNYQSTFFEILAVIGFLYFKDRKVDYGVLEVGVGGRLDAANVTHPELNFILNVCLEHTDLLGRSDKSILIEKQEVIKQDSHTVTLINNPELLRVLLKKCDKMNSSLYSLNNEFKVKLKKINLKHILFEYREGECAGEYKVPLTSGRIVDNIGAVIYGLSKIIDLNMTTIRTVLLSIHFPGRFQVLSKRSKLTILDGGHNTLSIESLVDTVRLLKLKKCKIIFTAMIDKKVDQIFKLLSGISKEIILTRLDMERELDLDEMFRMAKKYFNVIILTKNLQTAVALIKNHHGIITGSFYLVGRFLELNTEDKSR